MNGVLEHLLAEEKGHKQQEQVAIVRVGTNVIGIARVGLVENTCDDMKQGDVRGGSYSRHHLVVKRCLELTDKRNTPAHAVSTSQRRNDVCVESHSKIGLDGSDGRDHVDGCEWNSRPDGPSVANANGKKDGSDHSDSNRSRVKGEGHPDSGHDDGEEERNLDECLGAAHHDGQAPAGADKGDADDHDDGPDIVLVDETII